MLKELKENTDQEQKEIWKRIYEQSGISNKDIEFIKRTKQILRMEIYNWHFKKKVLEEFNSQCEQAEKINQLT